MSLQVEDYKWTLRAQCRHCKASSTLVITMRDPYALEVASQYLRRLHEQCQVAGVPVATSDESSDMTGGEDL